MEYVLHRYATEGLGYWPDGSKALIYKKPSWCWDSKQASKHLYLPN